MVSRNFKLIKAKTNMKKNIKIENKSNERKYKWVKEVML